MSMTIEMFNAAQTVVAAQQQMDTYDREMDLLMATTFCIHKDEDERLMARCSLSLKMADAAEDYAAARRRLAAACLSEANRIKETSK